MKFTVFFCAIVALLKLVQSYNYCAINLCPTDRHHIACHSNRSFNGSCPSNANMVKLKKFQNTILSIHNSYRNLIAGGGLKGYKPAERMATMQWDAELAELAAINVKQCNMQHDKCRNTVNFSKAGQNLAMITFAGPKTGKSNKGLIMDRINAWWKEYKDANMKIINSYPISRSGPAIGHFTVFVRDSNPRVGCAASRFTKGKMHNFLIACNYATTNIVLKPIYKVGRSTSGCKSGKHAKYKHLCSTAEVYSGL